MSGFNVQANAQSERDQMEVQVDGLGCPFCAYGLEKKFKEFKGIKNVNIEMETGIFTFTYPSEKTLTLEQIESQVDAAGYTAVSVKITRTDGTIESSEATETALTEVSEMVNALLFVNGNCGMCQARIEKAAMSVEGVTEAVWDKETKELTISYDQTQTDLVNIETVVSTVGHDTETMKTTKEVYNDLPGCCQYDRLTQE